MIQHSPAPCIYAENTKTLISKDICTPMFLAARFTIAKTWKQPKCPSTDEWIKKMWYIHTMEYYSAIKQNEIMPFAATWMDLEIFILSEISQAEKDKYYMISLICGILKNITNYLIYKRKIDSDIENKLMVTKGERGGGGIK